MCIIATFIKTEADKQFEKLIERIIEQQKLIHSDGVAIVAIKPNTKRTLIERDLKINQQLLRKIVRDYPIINIHLRTATSGAITKNNTHFWKIGEWLFAHNGWTGGEYDDKKTDVCDSYLVFKELWNRKCIGKAGRIRYQKIKKLINNRSFWGRFMLINIKNHRAYLFGDYHFYLVNDKHLIICSESLNFGQWLDFWGLYFQDRNEIKTLERKQDGIFMLDFSKRQYRTISDENFLKRTDYVIHQWH